MEESQSTGEMSHGMANISVHSTRSSYDSMDSGYLSLTPHSGSHTPLVAGCRTRSSYALGKRYHRNRLEPWQLERSQRLRPRLNHASYHSESICGSYLNETAELVSPNVDASSSTEIASSSVDSCGVDIDRSNLNGANGSIDSGFHDIGQATRRLRSHSRWSEKATGPVAPSSEVCPLSQPPSPEVPSSSFLASEPSEEDVEMKLVILPQSTPHVTTSYRCKSLSHRVTFSPCISRNSPIASTVDERKRHEFEINNLAAIPEIRPKRLDFSQKALSVAFYRARAVPDCTGRETVDLLTLLGEKSNHWRIVSKILSFLSPQDLCSISMVSKAWRRICANDSRANMRRLSYIILRQNAKENLKMIRKAKLEGDVQMSPKSRYARKGYLLEVQNLLQVPPLALPPNSPPVSPSKVRFHSFVKASRTLAPWEHLLPCPSCSFPCHVDREKNLGSCSRQGCSLEFCAKCSSKPHTGPCKTPLLATPTKRNKRLVVGSRQSKRNLRRL
ncbi:uncharacterized protein LOC105698885 [Orussus abietinus]|uniref:uncharacterized protein LOC105698885 n=1 Tax=Orussus abietinus TaxID=222816 RepID=UPI000625A34A|nr:uncharacterized protein LOC105698885 [Orussus abietinus]